MKILEHVLVSVGLHLLNFSLNFSLGSSSDRVPLGLLGRGYTGYVGFSFLYTTASDSYVGILIICFPELLHVELAIEAIFSYFIPNLQNFLNI